MFKGYLKTNGKVPQTKYTNGQTLLPRPPSSGDYAGALNDDLILIDVDDMEQSEVIKNIVVDLDIQCNILKTSRGMHFYFKNTNVNNRAIKANTPLGIRIDVGLGTKNSVIPLKVDGRLRRWIKQVDDLDELPTWLHPKKIPFVDFFNMGEGSGRNSELFNYILKLQTGGMSKPEIRECINLINQYIFKEQLTQREIDTITRDDAFSQENFFRDGKFQHNLFGNYLISNTNIGNIQGILHVYSKSGLYLADANSIETAMVEKIPTLKSSMRQEVLKYIKLKCNKEIQMSEPRFIGLKSKILDIETGTLLEYGPEYVLKNKIEVDYNPKAYSADVDKVLNRISCDDAHLRELIEEMIGFCLYRRNELGKAFILTEDGSNGKSTLLKMITELLGEHNCSNLEPGDLTKRFINAQLFGKLANLGDDISNNYIDNSSLLKKFITGEGVTVEDKGQAPFKLRNYAKMIFSANEVPRVNDTTGGFMRRLIIIPFKAKFDPSDDDFDPYIIDKLTTQSALEYLLKLAITGLERVLNNNKFSEPESVQQQLREYEFQNNPVLAFIDSGSSIEGNTTKEVYLKYDSWCKENGLKPLSNVQFGKILNKKLGYVSAVKKVNDKTFRIYQRLQMVTDGYR